MLNGCKMWCLYQDEMRILVQWTEVATVRAVCGVIIVDRKKIYCKYYACRSDS